MPYTDGFKSRMIQRPAAPDGPSATQLAREVGVPQSPCRAGCVGPVVWGVTAPYSPLPQAADIPEAELGAFLRRLGLHEAP